MGFFYGVILWGFYGVFYGVFYEVFMIYICMIWVNICIYYILYNRAHGFEEERRGRSGRGRC